MSEESDLLAKKLDKLIAKVDILTIVTANLSPQNQKAFEGKNQTEQIQILAKRKLPREAIAAIVGTTVETVSVRLSELKSKHPNKKNLQAKDEGKNDRPTTI